MTLATCLGIFKAISGSAGEVFRPGKVSCFFRQNSHSGCLARLEVGGGRGRRGVVSVGGKKRERGGEARGELGMEDVRACCGCNVLGRYSSWVQQGRKIIASVYDELGTYIWLVGVARWDNIAGRCGKGGEHSRWVWCGGKIWLVDLAWWEGRGKAV